MRKIIFVVLAIASLVILPSRDYALEEAVDELKLYLGEVKMLPVSNPSRVVIGNPAIVDVANVSKSELTLNPKAVGNTTLAFWDNFGEQSYKVMVFAENVQDIKTRVDKLLAKLNFPEVYTQVAEEESKVLLLGKVKTPQDRERIITTLGVLREKTLDLLLIKEEEAVVSIDVQVLELDKDATDVLGFTWPGSINILETGSPGLAGTQWGKLFRIFNVERGTSAGSDPFTLKLDFLVQEGKARILSRPRLACQSGKEAELLVGGEKPIFTTAVQATVGTSTSVEYKEYGIKLKIKPTVTEEKRLKVALNVEVSEVGTAEIIGLSTAPTAKAYPLSKRSASTELFLNDGQTMAIGGLMKQKWEEDIRKTPWLGDVPVFGALFRKKTTKSGGGTGERGDTELFITLTPTIVPREEPKASPLERKEIKPRVAIETSPVAANLPESLRQYTSLIQKLILDNLSYPDSAKQAGFQGTAKLSLHLSYLGELMEVSLKTSSGYKILDDNAASVARGVGSYPPFPSSVTQKDLWIDVPIAYRLD